MNIGQRVKKRRKQLKLSVDEMAEKLGKNRATVYRYESNDIENLPLEILEPLAKILRVSPAYLMGWEPEKELPILSKQYPYLPTTISAGLPIDIEGITQADKIGIPDVIMGKWSAHDDIFISKVNGDSMNKVMPDRSLIAVKPIDDVSQLNNGDIVVYKYDNEYAVKRYHNHGNGIIAFKPDSYDLSFEEKVINTNDGIDLKIKGKVVLHIVEHD